MKRFPSLKLLFYILVIWTILSAVLLLGYIFLAQWLWQGFYYIIWPVCAGGLIWRYREGLKSRFAHWKIPVILQYVLLAYIMVLGEEVLAATLNHLSEGFETGLYIKRIGQFWAFNILAFSGLIWGTAIIFTRYQFSIIEMFCLIGLYGQISEGLVLRLFSPADALASFVLIPLNFWVYGVIFLPSFLVVSSLPERKPLYPAWKYCLVVLSVFIMNMPFLGGLDWSRTHYPDIYPPRNFIR